MVTITTIGTHSMMIKEIYNKFFYYLYNFIYKINGSTDRLRSAISVVLILSILYTINLMLISQFFKVFHINLMYLYFVFLVFVHYWFYIRRKFYLELTNNYSNPKRNNIVIGAICLALILLITFVLSLIDYELKS